MSYLIANNGQGYYPFTEPTFKNQKTTPSNLTGKVFVSSYVDESDISSVLNGPKYISKIVETIKVIYKNNGFTTIDFQEVPFASFLAKKLNPQDTTILIWGANTDNSTDYPNFTDGTSQHASDKKHAELDSRVCYNTEGKRKPSNSDWDVIVGVLAAHEVLHSYLHKSTLMFFGKDEITESHSHDMSTVNLNCTGAILYPLLFQNEIVNTSTLGEKVKEGNFGNILEWQRLLIQGYFRGLNSGIHPSGKDMKSEETWKKAFPEPDSKYLRMKLRGILLDKIHNMKGNYARELD